MTEWPGRGRGAKIAGMAQLSESVSLDTTDSSVAVLTVDNPPVNALSWHVRQGIFDGLNQALADGASAVSSESAWAVTSKAGMARLVGCCARTSTCVDASTATLDTAQDADAVLCQQHGCVWTRDTRT